MTIDGTDFCIHQKGVPKKGNLFGSHKYAGESPLRYELGVDILAGNLVWVEGPYTADASNDVNFFSGVLSHCLEPGERLEADNGYVGHTDKIKCPNNDCNPAENLGMQSVARSRHKTLTGALKTGASWRRFTATTSRCTGRFFTRVR
jgi:hypothetical protein